MSRLHAPATQRNRDPILNVLRDILPSEGTVLEIASGTGEHVTYFAAALPHLHWQPSDADPTTQASISAWIASSGLNNVAQPVALDVHHHPWPCQSADAVLCINMVHISPWSATVALISGASALLPSDAPLYIYGPYRRNGRHTAASNEAFDQSLRSTDPAWGVRDMEAVVQLAEASGFVLQQSVAMPANNLSLVFTKQNV